MNVVISPKNILKFIIYLITGLLCLHLLGLMLTFLFNEPFALGFVPLFDFNHEINVPTLFSTLLLFFAAALLALIAFLHKKMDVPYLSWLLLSFIFMFLSLDEMASIHEKATNPMRVLLGTSGFFRFAWVIPYGIAFIIFGLFSINLLRKLPRKIMFLFLAGGSLFVFGAIGLEMIQSNIWHHEGEITLMYAFFATIEELMEMTGIAIFIYALLLYISPKLDNIKLQEK